MKQFTLLMTIMLTFGMMTGCGKKKENTMDEKNPGTPEATNNNPGTEVAVISTKFGDIVLEFFDELAPKHVESFKLHARNGYYNGTIFHRVIPDFMIQGGDITHGDGTGGESIYG